MTGHTPEPALRRSPAHAEFLRSEAGRLAAVTPSAVVDGGFGWLDEWNRVDGDQIDLWITARMTHVAGLAALAGLPAGPDGGGGEQRDYLGLVAHGVAALASGPLSDSEHDGWFARVSPSGPVDDSKQGYDHGFVVLAASTAAAVGAPGAEALLDRALTVFDQRFWDPRVAMVVESWDRSFSTLSDYRGVNANMHSVEALLAAADATGDSELVRRAAAIADRVVTMAAENGSRIPEHADPDWNALLDYNRDKPADRFRPYGATIGHGLEWSRLLLQLDVALQRDPLTAGGGDHADAAAALYERAVADGWAADGEDGFVYTTDWSGEPVTRTRMHWVCCEAILAAAALAERTGEERYETDYGRWWDYARRYLIDTARGSWHPELDVHNRPAATVWKGKPDLYHSVQACLLPDRPVASSAVRALAG